MISGVREILEKQNLNFDLYYNVYNTPADCLDNNFNGQLQKLNDDSLKGPVHHRSTRSKTEFLSTDCEALNRTWLKKFQVFTLFLRRVFN